MTDATRSVRLTVFLSGALVALLLLLRSLSGWTGETLRGEVISVVETTRSEVAHVEVTLALDGGGRRTVAVDRTVSRAPGAHVTVCSARDGPAGDDLAIAGACGAHLGATIALGALLFLLVFASFWETEAWRLPSVARAHRLLRDGQDDLGDDLDDADQPNASAVRRAASVKRDPTPGNRSRKR